jgi:ABC-type maltose transport system permease subunit
LRSLSGLQQRRQTLGARPLQKTAPAPRMMRRTPGFAVVVAMPTMLLFFIFQRQLVESIKTSGFK